MATTEQLLQAILDQLKDMRKEASSSYQKTTEQLAKIISELEHIS